MLERKNKSLKEGVTKSSIPLPASINLTAQRRSHITSSSSSLRSAESNNQVLIRHSSFIICVVKSIDSRELLSVSSCFLQGDGSRLVIFNPPKMHVLQPHSHRRHFPHHLRDHFSSPQIMRSFESREKVKKEIVPTLDACDYKVRSKVSAELLCICYVIKKINQRMLFVA